MSKNTSFAGLRVALQDADARIRIEEEVPQSFPYVMGMSLEGNFLDGQVIHFSRNLNCIIGGRGTGKSTAFEAIRCLSHTPSGSKLVDSEVWPENIHLVWVDRAGQQHIIRRRIKDDAENLSFPEVGAVFPIESYGQNETAQTSVKSHLDNTGLSQFRTPSLTNLDLRASQSLGRWWQGANARITLFVNNLLDNRDQFPSGYSYQFLVRDSTGDTLDGIPFYYPLATRNFVVSLALGF